MADFSWLYRGTAPHKPCPDCGYLTWAGQGRRRPGSVGDGVLAASRPVAGCSVNVLWRMYTWFASYRESRKTDEEM